MSSDFETRRPRVSLGIVSGFTNREAYICVLNHGRQSLSTFKVLTNGRSVRQEALDEAQCDVIDAPSIDAMVEFLVNEIPLDAAPALLVEAQKVLPHPEYQHTPAGVFSWDAASLCTLLTIATKGLRVPLLLAFYEVTDREAIVVHHVDTVRLDVMVRNRQQPKMLVGGLLRACAGLMIDEDPAPAQLAAVASLLASAPGAYYYWSTFMEPPSLGDVIAHHHIRQAQLRVITRNENFRMQLRFGPETAEDISLSYMMAVQENQDLGAHDANKFALVHMCKEFGYDLRCYSRRADARGGHPRRVWPWPDEDAWAVEKIRHLHQQK